MDSYQFIIILLDFLFIFLGLLLTLLFPFKRNFYKFADHCKKEHSKEWGSFLQKNIKNPFNSNYPYIIYLNFFNFLKLLRKIEEKEKNQYQRLKKITIISLIYKIIIIILLIINMLIFLK